MIEDSRSGIKAAKNAGMKIIGLTTSLREEDMPEVDLIASDYTGLKLNDLHLIIDINK